MRGIVGVEGGPLDRSLYDCAEAIVRFSVDATTARSKPKLAHGIVSTIEDYFDRRGLPIPEPPATPKKSGRGRTKTRDEKEDARLEAAWWKARGQGVRKRESVSDWADTHREVLTEKDLDLCLASQRRRRGKAKSSAN